MDGIHFGDYLESEQTKLFRRLLNYTDSVPRLQESIGKWKQARTKEETQRLAGMARWQDDLWLMVLPVMRKAYLLMIK